MKHWYLYFPGEIYALGPIEAENEQSARQWAREWLGVRRLPNGFGCWQA